MKGDFTRDTFDERSRFTRVLMQQGRVQLDADWNEQVSALLHYIQTLAADLIGPYGGPEKNLGFEISSDKDLSNDFFIGAGHYYVDGILCELSPEVINTIPGTDISIIKLPSLILDGRELAVNDWLEIPDDQDIQGAWSRVQVASLKSEDNTLTLKQTQTKNAIQKIRRATTYKQQMDYPDAELTAKTNYLAYLDVWERHITMLDDGHIHEVALNDVDTTTRAKVMQQVKLMQTDKPDDLKNLDPLSRARMRAQLNPEDPTSDPCIVVPNSKYRGTENQLYRVEIHRGSTDASTQDWTFKWSRENGSIAALQTGTSEDGGFIVNNTRGFSAEQWVEVTQEVGEVLNRPGMLTQITSVEADVIKLKSSPGGDANSRWKIRRWDQSQVGDTEMYEGAVKGKEGTWLDLESGIQVYFEKGGNYRSGDYWLIPARVATGQIEWPLELDAQGNVRTDADGNDIPQALAPHGIKHHYAPLALLTWDEKGLNPEDHRCGFELTPHCRPLPKGK
jgi:hypothetical protein